MKKTLKLFVTLSAIILFANGAFAQLVPKPYTLEVKNANWAPGINQFGGSTLQFDLIFTNIDPLPVHIAGWQFFFKLPVTAGILAPGFGAGSSFMLDTAAGVPVSDLPEPFRPRNSNTVAATNAPGNYELRIAANSLPAPGCGNGLEIASGVPTLIGRYNVKFSNVQDPNTFTAQLSFRDSCEVPLSTSRTKINAYDVKFNCIIFEMTRCANHIVTIIPLPIFFIMNLKIAPEGLYNSTSDKLFRKDSVTMYLRNINSPYQKIDSAKALLDSVNVNALFNFSITQTGNYYFSVKTRNTLETWCKSGGINIYQGGNSYDMTTSASQAYGNNMVLKGSRYCVYSGNVNNDQIIDSDDLSIIENDAYNFVLGNGVANLNGDTIVDIDDMAIVDINAENLRLVEWPGLTLEMRKNLKSKIYFSGGNK